MQKLIWVVDDDAGILEVTEIVLKEAGFGVVTIPNETRLNAELSHKLPHLILLDVMINGVDGTAIGKRLKSDPKTKHIPLLMMSADPDIQLKVKQAKADGYLKKPYDIKVLEEVVKKYSY